TSRESRGAGREEADNRAADGAQTEDRDADRRGGTGHGAPHGQTQQSGDRRPTQDQASGARGHRDHSGTADQGG
ncbi:hypothetical protein C3R44_24400, partial [Mycobacterium tuberculosis]